MGRLAYTNKKYSSARDYFESVKVADLDQNEKAEFYFKSGYCLFKTKKLSEAKDDFTKVTGIDSKYQSPAKYYLAHIAYEEEDYEKALMLFDALSDDKNFQAIIPYYQIQILFAIGRYDEVLMMGPELLKTATAKRAPEIARIIGESYYFTGEFEKALPYLQQYQDEVRTFVNREDKFIYGFALYTNQQFAEAVPYFQGAIGTQDTLSQFAYYYLGACYLETDQKQFAANAFTSSYKLGFDEELREDALFNQAQLAFELSYDPYNEAIKALKTYLEKYPDSKRNDEAYNFLYKISVATRNYKDAQEALDKLRVKGNDFSQRLQKITYYRGIELFNQFNYEEALEMFKKAIDNDADKAITASSMFWAGESFYKMENYWGAKKYFLDFLSAKGAKKLPIYNTANYDLGFVYFKKKEYSGAIYHFKDFIANHRDESPVMIADAFIRLGDSWFIQKGYDNAISYYDKAISLNAIDVDYAMFQKAIALGVLLRYDEKITTLKSILVKFPKSSSVSEVIYELGNTYLVLNDNENALLNFKKIAAEHPKSIYAVKARLKSGLIYYNNGLNDLALSTFIKVVEDYPNADESKEALGSIKNIYVEQNRVDAYLAFVNDLPFAEVRASEQDSITYFAAENLYMENSNAACESLRNYLEKFPEGAFALSANFYLGDCYFGKEEFAKALPHFEYVAGQPKSAFTENSLLKSAVISYNTAAYQKALDYYKRLQTEAENKININEAWYGQMKCFYSLHNYNDALIASSRFLEFEKTTDEKRLEAMQIKAKSLFDLDDLLLAKSSFRKIAESSQGEAGAEAKYMIAMIEFMVSNFDVAESEIFELANQYAAYDYWVAKGFILLSEVYVKKENVFQAKQTLQSIIDNYEGDDLKQIAISKLNDLIDEEEETENQLQESDSISNEQETIEIEGELIDL
ncbi:MAG: tetratricopeptide repeat protein [Bacteroidales bacterium]